MGLTLKQAVGFTGHSVYHITFNKSRQPARVNWAMEVVRLYLRATREGFVPRYRECQESRD